MEAQSVQSMVCMACGLRQPSGGTQRSSLARLLWSINDWPCRSFSCSPNSAVSLRTGLHAWHLDVQRRIPLWDPVHPEGRLVHRSSSSSGASERERP